MGTIAMLFATIVYVPFAATVWMWCRNETEHDVRRRAWVIPALFAIPYVVAVELFACSPPQAARRIFRGMRFLTVVLAV